MMIMWMTEGSSKVKALCVCVRERERERLEFEQSELCESLLLRFCVIVIKMFPIKFK